MQATAHFSVWTHRASRCCSGFGLAYLINKKFRGHGLWTTIIVLPMMLSPAVVGNFWTFLYQPQIGLFNYVVAFFTGVDPSSLLDDRRRQPGALGDRHRRHMDVDALRHADLPRRAALDPGQHLRGGRMSTAPRRWRQFWTITLPMVLPFLMLAVLFRGIENFKMFDLVVELTGGGPGSITELTSINLKREAFEKWRTGYATPLRSSSSSPSSALASIYVKALQGEGQMSSESAPSSIRAPAEVDRRHAGRSPMR